jgi:hypothetical protein
MISEQHILSYDMYALRNHCRYTSEDGTYGANILWRVEPLIWNDREISKYTGAISRQRLGKHVPAATNAHATIQVLLETGCFCVVRAEML